MHAKLMVYHRTIHHGSIATGLKFLSPYILHLHATDFPHQVCNVEASIKQTSWNKKKSSLICLRSAENHWFVEYICVLCCGWLEDEEILFFRCNKDGTISYCLLLIYCSLFKKTAGFLICIFLAWSYPEKRSKRKQLP